MVTAHDEIFAERRQGDWIVVRLADLPQQEAWMLVCTPEQQLLVPVEETLRAVSAQPAALPAAMLAPAPALVQAPSYPPALSSSMVGSLGASQQFGAALSNPGYGGGYPAAAMPYGNPAIPQQMGELPAASVCPDTAGVQDYRPATAAPTARLPDSVPYVRHLLKLSCWLALHYRVACGTHLRRHVPLMSCMSLCYPSISLSVPVCACLYRIR